ncbi:hypothetical protein [Chitinophaga rhizosphaerae]|uniref:hypothetical protein n=1 Tax=Chitinophaga rhizosphaerae TaxID=1864947 RepID=UPI000F811581|nr:hypothetical protein [Chitinophaga rhizosphaerae]
MRFIRSIVLAGTVFACSPAFAQLTASGPLEIGASPIGWTSNGWKKALKFNIGHAVHFPGPTQHFGLGATQTGSTSGLFFFTTPTDAVDAPATYRMALLANGNLGIGTLTPVAMLDVQGTFRLGVGSNMGGEAYAIGFTRTASAQLFSSVASGLTLGGDGNGFDMAILPNGNVGIGTSTPAQKLSVDGTILAKKVKVSTAAADWPDYVFLPGYQLPALSSIEHFIAQNGHLPDIPSAATIKKDGQDLGEINKQLVKKVEELTLYLIEMEKQQQAMKATIRELLERSKGSH